MILENLKREAKRGMIEPPRTKAAYIPERLITLFNRMNQSKITCITAPAGYGKTTLVKHWSQMSKVSFTWWNMAQQTHLLEQMEHLLLNAHKQKRVIVLDNFHLLNQQSIVDMMKRLIVESHSRVKFIILSRNFLTEIKSMLDLHHASFHLMPDELKLTFQESAQWIEQQPGANLFDITEQQLQEIFDITDGCPKLLQIAYQNYCGEGIPLIDKKGRLAPLLEKYVIQEWMDSYPTEFWQQLQPIALTPYFSLELARDLVDINQASPIDSLEKHFLLKKMLVKNNWMYRFHPMVRAVMNERFQAGNKTKQDIMINISRFLGEEGLLKEAIEIALQSGHDELALNYIKEIGSEMLQLQEYSVLVDWFHHIDNHNLSRDKEALLLYQWASDMIKLNQGELDVHLIKNRKVDSWTKFISLNQGHIPFIRGQFGPGGNIQLFLDDQRKLDEDKEQKAFSPYFQLAFAEALYEINDLDAAQDHIENLWNYPVTNSQPGLSIPALWLDLLCYKQKGNINRVHYLTEEIYYRSLQTDSPIWRRIGHSIKIYTSMNEGFLEEAEEWLADQKGLLHLYWNEWTTFEYFIFARALLFFKEYEEASNLLNRMVTSTSIERSTGAHLERRILQTLTAIKLNHVDEAKKHLEESLEIGNKYGFKRAFLDEDPQLFSIFHLVENELPSHLQSFRTQLLQLANKEGLKDVKENPKTKDALTVREIEILNHIQQGHSNRVISNQMHITEGTVKGHIHRIFKKLGVKNRIQAVKKANEQLIF